MLDKRIPYKSEIFGRHKNQFNEGFPVLKQYLKVDPKWCW